MSTLFFYGKRDFLLPSLHRAAFIRISIHCSSFFLLLIRTLSYDEAVFCTHLPGAARVSVFIEDIRRQQLLALRHRCYSYSENRKQSENSGHAAIYVEVHYPCCINFKFRSKIACNQSAPFASLRRQYPVEKRSLVQSPIQDLNFPAELLFARVPNRSF